MNERKQKEYEANKPAYIRRANKSFDKTYESGEARLHRMLVEAKSRSKADGREFTVGDDDVIWNDVCPVLGIPISPVRGKGHGGKPGSPSLDRIDNDKGYVTGNVRIISWRANNLKRNMTREEARLLYENWDKITNEKEKTPDVLDTDQLSLGL